MIEQPMLRANNVGLSYASELFQDDLGSQLCRLYGVYVLARYLNVAYIHEPLRILDIPEKKDLEKNFVTTNVISFLRNEMTLVMLAKFDRDGKHSLESK